MLKGKDWRVLDKVLPIVVALISLSSEYDKRAPTVKAKTRYSVILADVLNVMRQGT